MMEKEGVVSKIKKEYSEDAVLAGKISNDNVLEKAIAKLRVKIPYDYRCL